MSPETDSYDNYESYIAEELAQFRREGFGDSAVEVVHALSDYNNKVTFCVFYLNGRSKNEFVIGGYRHKDGQEKGKGNHSNRFLAGSPLKPVIKEIRKVNYYFELHLENSEKNPVRMLV